MQCSWIWLPASDGGGGSVLCMQIKNQMHNNFLPEAALYGTALHSKLKHATIHEFLMLVDTFNSKEKAQVSGLHADSCHLTLLGVFAIRHTLQPPPLIRRDLPNAPRQPQTPEQISINQDKMDFKLHVRRSMQKDLNTIGDVNAYNSSSHGPLYNKAECAGCPLCALMCTPPCDIVSRWPIGV